MKRYGNLYHIAKLIPMKRELKGEKLTEIVMGLRNRKADPDEKGTERHPTHPLCNQCPHRKADPDEKGTESFLTPGRYPYCCQSQS